MNYDNVDILLLELGIRCSKGFYDRARGKFYLGYVCTVIEYIMSRL